MYNMRERNNLSIIKVLFICLAFLWLTCSYDNNVAGGSTETTNGNVVGMLYNENGTPAKNAKVLFITYNHEPVLGKRLATFEIGDSTTTDSKGCYRFKSMPADTYNVYGEDSAGNLCYQDSVVITGDTAKPDTVPPDTLKQPGSLAGFIKMEPGDDPRTVTIYVIGATKYALPESDASFSFTEMAEGTYRVRILSILDKYLPLDTNFTVDAGTDLNMPDSIELPLSIPKVKGFNISYDTLKQIVTLTWDRADTNKIKGYNVYRQHIDSTDVKLNIQPITDTSYVDSTGIQDETYIYSVVSVDLNNEKGIKNEVDSIVITSAYEIAFEFGTKGAGPGQFDEPVSISISDNGNIFIGDFWNDRVQKFNSSGEYISELTHTTFNWIGGIKVKDSRVYVVEQFHESVLIFDTSGTFIKIIADSIGLYYPSGIEVDNYGNVYIVDGAKIYKVDTTNVLLDSLELSEYEHGSTNHGIAIDSSGNIWVASTNVIQKFDSAGNYISSINIVDSRLLNFEFDKDDNLVIIDAISGRIKKYSQEGSLLEVFGRLEKYVDDQTGQRPVYNLELDSNGNLLLTLADDDKAIVFRRK